LLSHHFHTEFKAVTVIDEFFSKQNQNRTSARFCSSDFPRPIPTTHVANDPVPSCDAMRRTVETCSHARLECDTRKDREEIIPIGNQEIFNTEIAERRDSRGDETLRLL